MLRTFVVVGVAVVAVMLLRPVVAVADESAAETQAALEACQRVMGKVADSGEMNRDHLDPNLKESLVEQCPSVGHTVNYWRCVEDHMTPSSTYVAAAEYCKGVK